MKWCQGASLASEPEWAQKPVISLFSHPALRAYCVPGTRLGSGWRRWVRPNPVCQGICSLVRNTPCLLSYPTLTAGLEGRGARSSVSHSLKNWNGKTWVVITRKSSWRTKCQRTETIYLKGVCSTFSPHGLSSDRLTKCSFDLQLPIIRTHSI